MYKVAFIRRNKKRFIRSFNTLTEIIDFIFVSNQKRSNIHFETFECFNKDELRILNNKLLALIQKSKNNL